MGAGVLERPAPPSAPAVPPQRRGGRRARLAGTLRRAAPWLLLAAFATQLLLIVPRHEPWFDEAQAWLLARDSGLWELFAERLRYEGNPGLWHVLLMPLAKLGFPYEGLGWLSAGLALAGAVVLVRRGPFPLWAKAGLLCSFVLGYQEAVVARSYALLPLLLFLLADAWPQRTRRVWRVTALLLLLGGISLHGLLIAWGFAAVRAWEVRGRWPHLDAADRRRHLLAAGALVLQAVVIAVVLAPPDDLSLLAADWDMQPETMLWLLDRSLTGTGWLTGAALALTLPWFARTRTLALWVIPTGVLLLFLGLKYHAPHHEELPILVWLTVLWIACARDQGGGDRRWRQAALAGLAIVLAVQAVWFVRTWSYDWARPYSGGRELAAYLEGLPPGTEVWAADWAALAALPYFEDNRYANFHGGRPPSYWVWRADKTEEMELGVIEAYLGAPDVWIWPVKVEGERDYPDIPGYQRVMLIEGGVYSKDDVVDDEAFVVYERLPQAP